MTARYSKRHYEDVAQILKTNVIPPYYDTDGVEFMREELINNFVTLFTQDNPRFDEKRFRDACNT